MPSVLSGYAYDIFISYRHNDNRSGWVTEFVRALEEELSATIKDPVSVYLDTNPHDGLSETHQVDKSLEAKLKCLIFIPIISQTYCDPKSFAWQHEFCVFNKWVDEDPLGRNIRLDNGNVAGRILSIKIHDLDVEDKALLERELNGVLRAIEFIFSSAGVSRPLIPTDKREENLNKTVYRDQVNKVARAIKELLLGIRHSADSPAAKPSPKLTATAVAGTRKKGGWVTLAIGALVLLGFGYFYVARFGSTPVPLADRSIAVLPFVDMSPGHDQEYLGDGITEQIISSLAQLGDVKVIARTSVMKYKGSPKSIAEIGRELNVTHVLEGSVRKAGDHLRVTAKLIAVSDESQKWSEDFNDNAITDIFKIQDMVSMRIAQSLKSELSALEREKLASEKTTSLEAYEHYLKGEYVHGKYYYVKFLVDDFNKSEQEFLKAIELDSLYASAYAGLSNLYDTRSNSVLETEVEKFRRQRDTYANKAYLLAPRLPYANLVKYYSYMKIYEPEIDSAFKYICRAYAMAPNNALIVAEFGGFYGYYLGLFPLADTLFKQALQLNPASPSRYIDLGWSYYLIGEFDKAERSFQSALAMEPNRINSLYGLAFLQCADKRVSEAEALYTRIEKINPKVSPELKAMILASRGEREKALSLYKSARVYLALGMTKEALDYVEKEQWPYLSLENKYLFKDLQGDPRYKPIVEAAKVRYDEAMRKYGKLPE